MQNQIKQNTKLKPIRLNVKNTNSRILTFRSTKWIIRRETMHSILSKRKDLLEDANMKAKIHYVYAKMKKFSYCFGSQSDNFYS